MNPWFKEYLHKSYGQTFEVSETLYEKQTEHQHLVIFDNPLFGRVLALDGVIQTTERDEHIYHEMFAHVPLFSHACPQSVLIIGGGDGGLLREVLRHSGVSQVTLVEIDADIIALSSQYLPGHSQGAFDDKRVDIVIQDGAAFVRDTKQRYDVILTDSTDPIGPGKGLFQSSYYIDVMGCLNEGGVLVTQNGVSCLQLEELVSTHRNLQDIVSFHGFFFAVVPTYLGGSMSYAWASPSCSLQDSVELPLLQTRFDQAALAMKYYTPAIHMAAFAQPADVQQALALPCEVPNE